jgi:proton glutamate symport protein
VSAPDENPDTGRKKKKPRLKLHWQVAIGFALGVLGGGLALTLPGQVNPGLELEAGPEAGTLVVTAVTGGFAERAKLRPGDVLEQVGKQSWSSPEDLLTYLEGLPHGRRVSVKGVRDGRSFGRLVRVRTPRGPWVRFYDFFGDIFLRLLKLLIVPLVFSSIVCGVVGVGRTGGLGRLGAKTLVYYVTTSFLAISIGLVLVNVIRPGDVSDLPLTQTVSFDEVTDEGFVDIFRRMVPENVIGAFSDNRLMLQVIFFSLLLGVFLTRLEPPAGTRLSGMIEDLFQVMMKMAHAILALIPFGVFFLIAKVVATTGFGVFKPLSVYMVTVTAGLLVHAFIVLPLLLRFVGRVNPLRYAQAVSPALLTAFSTSSSSVTLPVTLDSVENRGKVSNRVTSFVLPLGATVNMDGTALYECVGVIFLSQFYAATQGYVLTVGDQVTVVVMALMASIGAAGIPSAGLIMMLTILAVLDLPLEGAALLLAVDRPLDMLRTTVNVWSDSTGSAVIARTEGEGGMMGALEAGRTPSPSA